jgi:ribulose-5-phosphate 4-epimerase/fuculose-1-phosphate aldolase
MKLTQPRYGIHFGLIKVSDLILLNGDGRPVGGATHLPAGSAGFQIHSHLHKRYPHINAACHTHSTHGMAYSAFSKRLDMINLDVLDFYGDAHGVYIEFGGVTLNEEESDRLAQALGPKGKGLILRNHGLLTVGGTVDEAAYLFCLMEKSCEIQLAVDAAAAGSGNKKVLVEADAAKFTFNTMSDPVRSYCLLPTYPYIITELLITGTGNTLLCFPARVRDGKVVDGGFVLDVILGRSDIGGV